MRRYVFLFAAALTLSGCPDERPGPSPSPAPEDVPLIPPAAGEDDRQSWTPVAPTELDPVQVAQRERALAAKDALFQRLSGRLQAAIAEGGPALAIDVCRTEAPQLARAVSVERGVQIGRTSARLRNQTNVGPAWTRETVAGPGEAPVLVEGSQGHLGALLPIRTQALCVLCHGPSESLAPGVREALSEHYPQDEATGFREGDLRGWFWVDVPPPSAGAAEPGSAPQPTAPEERPEAGRG